MILVTGGAGLVGKELIKQLLAKGEQVVALYNKTPLTQPGSALLKTVQCDILDVVGLDTIMETYSITQVYHCAAIVSFNPAKKAAMFKINIEGTANLVNAALQAGVKKMVHVSSVAALGRIRENEMVTERMNWTEEHNNSNYGKSKYLGEMEVWRGMGEGLDAVIVNPVIILGDGDWEAGSSKIFKSIFEEFPWYSDGVTGFADVRDVAKAMIELMHSNISGERFIISAENKSYRDLFTLVAKAFNKKLPHKLVTPFIAQVVWRLEAIKSFFTGKDPLVTKETANTALAKVYYDNSKLKQFLPSFQYTSIEDTVNHTCKLLQHKLNRH
jgi:dihydroflavonol-4-reductase